MKSLGSEDPGSLGEGPGGVVAGSWGPSLTAHLGARGGKQAERKMSFLLRASHGWK